MAVNKLRDRSLVTVVALVDSSFQYHLLSAKKNGITKAAPRGCGEHSCRC